jgi:diguanylate cyclase (GGDEF)-like protein
LGLAIEAESADIEPMTAAVVEDELQPALGNDARVAPIWLYNVGLIATALILWVTVLRHLDGHRIVAVGWPWWTLGLVFYLAEAYVVHVQFRREAHTISLNEVALVVGLYVLSPVALLVATLAGAAAALVIVRRQRAAKLVFNLAQLALTTSVAMVVFRLVERMGSPFGPVGWTAVLLATVAASLAGILLVTVAIALAEGSLSLEKLPVTVGISLVSTIAMSNFVLIAMELVRTDRARIVLLALPAAVAVAVFRAFASQARRHEHLEFLYESMKATQGAPEFSLAVGQLLMTVRQLVRAEYAEIFLFPTGHERGLRSVLAGAGGTTDHPEVVTPADAEALELLEAGDGSVLLSHGRAQHPIDAYLSSRGLSDGIIAALRGEDGAFGLLVVGERSGDVETFNADDRRLLETFVGHASVMLENGRLERSLAEVTDLKERLRHQAFHDMLTGLPNRALFTERVEAALANGNGSAVVLFLDLDDFKTINDTLGHAMGDTVLTEVAQRVRSSVRAEDTAARLGGDEFAVLLESPGDDGGEVVATTLLEAMREPITLGNRETMVATSIGIASASSAASGDELLRNADVAMYAAKESGKHRFAHYEPEMHVAIKRRHEFEVELKRALELDEIGVVFEPIVSLADGKIVAFEALARWFSPKRGMVRPAEFIPVAEELGLMSQIGRRVLRQACQAARTWQTRYPSCSQTSVSVNLSPSELTNEQLAEAVARALFETRLSPQSLMLEITESEMMRDLDVAHQRMDELRALGVRLVLDDFGTGRSSLERLATFPLDALKIAKPFVDRLLGPGAETGFIDTFVQLAKALDIDCIAEGIEHASQVHRLVDRGCPLGQGFHFTPPMTKQELDRYLATSAIPLISPSLSSAAG